MSPPDASRPAGCPKAARLRTKRDFEPVRTRGRRYVGAQASIRSVANGGAGPRIGIAASRKYGRAVRRNRFRRLVRAAFRTLAPRLPARDYLVEPRRDLAEPDLATLAADLAAAAGIPVR